MQTSQWVGHPDLSHCISQHVARLTRAYRRFSDQVGSVDGSIPTDVEHTVPTVLDYGGSIPTDVEHAVGRVNDYRRLL